MADLRINKKYTIEINRDELELILVALQIDIDLRIEEGASAVNDNAIRRLINLKDSLTIK